MGTVVQLTGWALAAATVLESLLPVWPVLVVLPFLLVGRLRQHWRIAPELLPVWWSWGVAAVLVLAGLRAVSIFRAVSKTNRAKQQQQCDRFVVAAALMRLWISIPSATERTWVGVISWLLMRILPATADVASR